MKIQHVPDAAPDEHEAGDDGNIPDEVPEKRECISLHLMTRYQPITAYRKVAIQAVQ
jgi:hypothetical protein